MSRTYKYVPSGPYGYRRPRGELNAKRNNARKKAIPPNAWDDICHCKETTAIYNVILRMHKKGWDDEKIARKINQKWNMGIKNAYKLVKRMQHFSHVTGLYYFWRCNCNVCRWENGFNIMLEYKKRIKAARDSQRLKEKLTKDPFYCEICEGVHHR